jgi:hypothetical protein
VSRAGVWRTLAGIASLVAASASAQDVKVHAFADLRVVDAPDTTSFIDGGPGHTRYGGNDRKVSVGAAALVVTAQITPALFALADVQLQRTDRNDIQLPEAFLRYRPVSTSAWRASAKAGVYFIPVSLENDGLGWTSPWTITPSALNSWVGEELRGVGAEMREEWRGDAGSFNVGGGLFRQNDVAGNILVLRGWSLSDVTYGLGGELREPASDGEREQYDPFHAIGGRTGYYADAGWKSPEGLELRVLRYDNRADPSASVRYAGDERLFAWRTRFWSAGASWVAGPVTFISQAMDGDTAVKPGALSYVTRFQSAFLLAGWNRGAWRPTLRVESFRTWPSRERGHAVTAALNWRPLERLRLTAEWLHIDANRQPLPLFGDPSRQRGNQLQLLARVFY